MINALCSFATLQRGGIAICNLCFASLRSSVNESSIIGLCLQMSLQIANEDGYKA